MSITGDENATAAVRLYFPNGAPLGAIKAKRPSLARGARVLHITGPGEPTAHAVTPWAHRDGVRLTYPPRQGEFSLG